IALQSERRIITPSRAAAPESNPGSLARAVPRATIAARSWVDAERLPVDEADTPVDTAAYDFAEKTLIRAKKHAKELTERTASYGSKSGVKLARVEEPAIRKSLAAALRSGRAL